MHRDYRPKPPILLLQCYGPIGLYHQSAVLLASLNQVTDANFGGIDIVAYTDRPDWWAQHFSSIQVVLLTAAQIEAWQGPQKFVHRLKVEMIRDCFRRYCRPICYLDSDCYFTRDPRPFWAQISPLQSLMHEYETRLDQPVGVLPRKIARFLRRAKLHVAGHPGQQIPLQTELWNAGLLGIHPALAPVVDDVLAWTDALYQAYPKHIMEQLAFSYLLAQHSQLTPATEWVAHYWAAKKTINPMLEEAFANTQQPVLTIAQSVLPQIPAAQIRHAEAYALGKRPFWRRWFG